MGKKEKIRETTGTTEQGKRKQEKQITRKGKIMQ